MAQVVPDLQQEFWRSPHTLSPAADTSALDMPLIQPALAAEHRTDTCAGCGMEFMIAARFCHACGMARPAMTGVNSDAMLAPEIRARIVAFGSALVNATAAAWRKFSFPRWMHYLHFHEIKSWIGLPTAALISFMIGLGCVAGAIGVSLIYKASNLPEFQAIQMWRIEWLLAATAAFLAGVLLKTPPDNTK